MKNFTCKVFLEKIDNKEVVFLINYKMIMKKKNKINKKLREEN